MCIRDRTKREEDGNYTLWKGVTEFLDTDRAMSCAVCVEQAGTSQRGQYVCLALNGNNEAASIDFCMMEADGVKIKNDGVTTMQTDFLRYLPRNFNAVAAFGAVSYTHLDVYKRQVPHGPAHQNKRPKVRVSFP